MQCVEDTSQEVRFSFGKNWGTYIAQYLTEERILAAQQKTLDFLGMEDLRGRRFLDIGCGSGLFSLIAHRLGASEVLSFDIDEDSVGCCRALWEQAGRPDNWTVTTGSILDEDFVESLPRTDIVYSWGVLHHTGQMYNAIRNAAGRIAPGGHFYIAIYNKQEYRSLTSLRGSHYWVRVKHLYNTGGPLIRFAMRSGYKAKDIIGMLASFKNPFRAIRNYSSMRGMSWSVDITDWLGGYPYEFARVDEIFTFCRRECGLELENVKSTNSLGCNEFLFRRPADRD